MRKIITILTIITFSTTATAQWTTSLNTGGMGEDIRSIYFINIDTGFAISNNGVIIKTFDGGTNWGQTTFGTSQNFNEVYFINDTLGFITGDTTLIKTIDGGVSWSSLSTISYGKGICFINDTLGYVYSDTSLYKSIDAGSIWTKQIHGPSWPYYISKIYFVNDSIAYSTGGNQINKSINGGIDWSQQFSSVSGVPKTFLNGIFFTDINTGYIVGGHTFSIPNSTAFEGVILKTIDGGANWTEQLRLQPNRFTSVFFTSSDTGYVVGCLNDVILKTVDAGTTWAYQTTPPVQYLTSIHFVNSNVGYVSGRNGVILKTINGGTSIIETKFSIYPNPTSTQLTIDSDLTINDIYIISITGKTIKTIKQNTGTINVANLPAGIYLIKVITEERTITKKFIKQ